MSSALLLGWLLGAAEAPCVPATVETTVLPVLVEPDGQLGEHAPLARALIADAAPFELTNASTSRAALTAESGLRSRMSGLERARLMVEKGWDAFGELEDERALKLVTEAVPLLAPNHADPEGARVLARAHLLAGAVYLARGRVDAASNRLRRALDLSPGLEPPASSRLIGALEAVRAAQRGEGAVELGLTGTASTAEVWIDGRRMGEAPGRLLISSGRHLLRVAAPGHRSHTVPIEVEDGRTQAIEVHLAEDPLLRQIARLGGDLRSGLALDALQRRLAERAGADRTLVAGLVFAPTRGPHGRPRPALILDLEGAGRSFAPTLDRAVVAAALLRLARCQESTFEDPTAPPVEIGLAKLDPEPKQKKVQRLPILLFAGLALAGLGLAAGVAIGQGTSAPPGDVEIRLVPRP